MVKATVIIPTFDHHDMILRAIASVKRQTVQDFEVFIVGDGVSDPARELLAQACEADNRLHFFDNPKGRRTGETHRHKALQDANGEVVCYLADDDLWLPDHLEAMIAAGRNADFFHSLHVGLHPNKGFYFLPADLEDEAVRQLMCNTMTNRFGLSFCGHTLAAYRKLPFGWRTAPDGVPTDLHMWRQFLLAPGLRAKTLCQSTALNFAANFRKQWSHEQRLRELDRWLGISSQPGFRTKLDQALIAAMAANKNAPMGARVQLGRVRAGRWFEGIRFMWPLRTRNGGGQ